MDAAASSDSLRACIRKLGQRHRNASAGRSRDPAGPELRRSLGKRLEKVEARIVALPDNVSLEIVGLDWIEENQHIIREAIAQIAGNLPRGYVRRLPVTESESGKAVLRIADLAQAIVSRADFPLDIDWIERFLDTYQSKVSLTIGELWALPTFLRVIVIDRLLDAAEDGVAAALADSAGKRRLQIEAVVSGGIVSLRALAARDWRAFVERLCSVEHILATDPSGYYSMMDRESRNRYRERVESLARKLHCTERAVAETAITLARRSSDPTNESDGHAGYYLVDRGVTELRATLLGGSPAQQRSKPLQKDILRPLYVTAIALPSLAILVVLARWSLPAAGWMVSALLIACATVPVLTAWTEIVNWLITQSLPPRILPKLDLSDGIPADWATIVAVPCMLDDFSDTDRLLASLETGYMGNNDPRLSFVLLSDYQDSDKPDSDGDSALLEHACAGIEALNERHGSPNQMPFALMHRRRLWNETARLWMGWERKRGKIEEFNLWLLGADDTSFEVLHGDTKALRRARFVVTLDADNKLLPGTAARLLGTLAHPLNRPRFDEQSGRVSAGYTVIQPRVDIHPSSANRSIFSRMMSGDVGIDLYHAAVSELYHDLFGEGIYAGKGIYDVRAFTRSVGGRVPPNAVLSHDLLEGLLGRAGLASDIVVLENASPDLATELKRQHRWIRGDWQLLPWLIPWPGQAARRRDVDTLGRFKLFDNLRRSLLPPSLFALLLAAWLFVPGEAVTWTIAVVLVPAIPLALTVAGEIRGLVIRWGTLRSSLVRIQGAMASQLARWAFQLMALPLVAGTALDAIARTLVRVMFTRRNLLEWVTAARGEKETRGASMADCYRRMALAPAAGLAALAIPFFLDAAEVPATLFGSAWLFLPALSWATARERDRPSELTADDRIELRKLARRTWRFYDRFVGPETHWLPPDNYQEAPTVSLAERTSPTNIGLFLLASVSAWDLGYIGADGLVTRLDGTTGTLDRMKKFCGHLFNWYRTTDLEILAPDYVSTVDSGNLVASLIICRGALEELEETKLPAARVRDALADLVANIEEISTAHQQSGKVPSPPLSALLDELRQRLDSTGDDPDALSAALADIGVPLADALERAVLEIADTNPTAMSAPQLDALRSWITQLRHEAGQLRQDVDETRACLSAARALTGLADPVSTLGHYRQLIGRALEALDERGDAGSAPNEPAIERLRGTRKKLDGLFDTRNALLKRIDGLIAATDFRFLYDASRNLFHIGYNNSTGTLDPAYYDLLASEARIASLVAIAKQDVPTRHWIHLGRPLRRLSGMRVVLSWSATAFEYLMPRLFMATPDHGILDVSCQAVIREQRKLARRHQAPWGVSESAYFELDGSGHYKYHAFGVDSLALRRARNERYVVTPYACILGLPFQPRHVMANLERLHGLGCWGRFGLYEALDFGERSGDRKKPRLVQSFMAHHQGMILGTIANALSSDSMLRRFHAYAPISAVEHLLYEALPRRAQDRVISKVPPARPRRLPVMTADHVRIPEQALDRHINVLGNGHTSLRTTGRGGGNISWNGRAITRWRPRVDGANGGDRIYLQDLGDHSIHVIGWQPDGDGISPELWAAPHQSELHQRTGDLVARVTMGVAPDNDVVIRRVTLTNEGRQARRIELTHYAELVLADDAEDQRHPAFNKLFVASEQVRGQNALVFSRRSRASDEAGLSCAFGMVTNATRATTRFETDRRRFIGRAGSYRKPAAMRADIDAGIRQIAIDTLDPVAAVSVQFELPAATTVQVAFTAALSPDRQQALELSDHFNSLERIAFSLDQARLRAAAELTGLRIDSATMIRLIDYYPDMLWPRPFRRTARPFPGHHDSVLSFLWSRGISGDFPVAVAWIREHDDLRRATEMLILQRYLGDRGVPIDVILADETQASYATPMLSDLDETIARYRDVHRPGNAFVLSTRRMSPSERVMLEIAGLTHVMAGETVYDDPRDTNPVPGAGLPPFVAVRESAAPEVNEAPRHAGESRAEFDCGYGHMDAASGDYVIDIDTENPPPAPWINVLANRNFGCIVSERGSACTWFGNSSEQRLTPWYNDPVCDRSGEALYLRDEESGEFWSPTPGPRPGARHCRARHGSGFSVFEQSGHGLEQRVHMFVDHEKAVKFLCVDLENVTDRPRRLTLTLYTEWVWGNHPETTGPYLFMDMADTGEALLARNVLPRSGSEQVAFVTSTAALHGHTTDRREFLGPARDPARPAALELQGLSGNLIAGGEPCCAYQVHVNLPKRGKADVTFALGAAESLDGARDLAAAARSPAYVADRRARTEAFWNEFQHRLTIRTPNAALDQLFNHWLGYQNLAARLWARTGLYQSAGGFGFRDQLQDSLALLYTWPELARQQILGACRVQFAEGDVLHWWHENPLRGVRSRCADDLLWLPYATHEYLRVTGDTTLLDEQIPWLAGEALRPDETERYAEFAPGPQLAGVYEHCARAIDARTATGAHGLPLFGSGDWNDGFNRVGIEGRGESAWMGWFLADILARFAGLAAGRGEQARALELEQRKTSLLAALERETWTGDRYLRGYYDDGSELGTAASDECRIDLNAQTWPALTGLGRPDRVQVALDSLETELIEEKHRLIRLLAPPFDRSSADPGYIRGYPPGVRENGGQYTHAAAWAVFAALRTGQPRRALHWLDLLNPLLRVKDRAAADHYRGEPYVLAGDVYAGAGRSGRSGWTWYTGSAGWIYRIVIEELLGIKLRAGSLNIAPVVPEDWREFTVELQVGASRYSILVTEPAAVGRTGAALELDGNPCASLRLTDDGKAHRVVARPGAEARR